MTLNGVTGLTAA